VLERLHEEGHSEVLEYVNNNRVGVNLLVPGDVLYDLIMDELRPKQIV
jgi:hypothetical protein